jgi:hypothetical protein
MIEHFIFTDEGAFDDRSDEHEGGGRDQTLELAQTGHQAHQSSKYSRKTSCRFLGIVEDFILRDFLEQGHTYKEGNLGGAKFQEVP